MDTFYHTIVTAINIVWLGRDDHDYSSTKLKTDIYNSVKGPMQRGYGYD